MPKITKPASPARRTQKSATDVAHIPWKNATRRILTRSQSKIFRLPDLPPELRNLIYHHAAASFSATQPIELETVTLPAALSPSHQVRAEALAFFFSANHFKLRVTSNYCVFRRHFHQHQHLRSDKAGTVALPPLITQGLADAADEDAAFGLKEEMVRFRHVTFEVDCVCCDPAKMIARLELRVQGSRAEVECAVTFKSRQGDKATKTSLEFIFRDVRTTVEAIGERDGFNGFTVADLVAVAACASYQGKKGHEGLQTQRY